jgi:hypothetical protein
MLIVMLICAGLLIWSVIHEIRDIRKKEFLAKLMDCEYVQIGYGDYFIPKN